MEDKKRQEGAQARPCHYSGLDPIFRHRQASRQTNDVRVEDASIRIGSNIHHSQATPLPSQAQKSASLICQSESSDLMLLDKEVSSNQEVNHIKGTSSNILPAQPETTEVPGGMRLESSLPPLDQLRDSETFDQVKARSSSISKQNRADEQQKSLEKLQRGAANGSLASEEVVSSSAVIGRKPLESTPLPSRMDDLQSRVEEAQGLPPSLRQQVIQQVPDGLSRDFLPSDPEVDGNSGRTNRNFLHSSPRLTSRPPSAPSISQSSHLRPIECGSRPSHRTMFTLELQVEAKAQAAGRVDASKSDEAQPFGIVSMHEGNDSPPKAYTRIATDDPHKTIEIASAVQEDPTERRDTSAQDDARRHPEVGESLRYSRRAELPQTGNRSLAASSNVFHAKHISQDRTQQRQLSQGPPMRRRLGKSVQPAPVSDGRRDIVEAQSDEKEARMRAILKDNPGDVSNSFFCDPCVRKHWVLGQARRWVRCHPRVDETLPEGRQLQMTRSQYQGRSSPRQTALTTANATIAEPNANVEAYALDDTSPSETDFLSQFSPMGGQLEESLLNLSVYTNPARTERSYIAAPSQTPAMHESGIQSDFVDLPLEEAQNVSPGRWSQDYSQTRRSSMNDCPTQTSYPSTSRVNPPLQRTPLKAISNLFADPRRSSFNPLKRAPDNLKESLESPSMMTRSSKPRILGNQRMDPPPSADGTSMFARYSSNKFPLNYTPIRHATRKRQQSDSATHEPSSPYSTTPQFGRNQNDIVARTPGHIPHSKTSSSVLSSSYNTPIQHLRRGNVAGRLMNTESRPDSKQDYQHEISAASSRVRPSHQSLATPLGRQPSSPDHFVFQEPPPSLARRPGGWVRAAPSSNPRPMRRPLSPRQLDPFNTPRPTRRPSPGPGPGPAREVQPFSTPRPVRSVLGQFQRPLKPILLGAYEWRMRC
jgi:hypothetical protein